MGSIHTVPLNEAIVVSGGCTGGGRTFAVGGWVWAWWMISDVQVNITLILLINALYIYMLLEGLLFSFSSFVNISAHKFGGHDSGASLSGC